jgi:hypothetical protein
MGRPAEISSRCRRTDSRYLQVALVGVLVMTIGCQLGSEPEPIEEVAQAVTAPPPPDDPYTETCDPAWQACTAGSPLRATAEAADASCAQAVCDEAAACMQANGCDACTFTEACEPCHLIGLVGLNSCVQIELERALEHASSLGAYPGGGGMY